MRSSRSENFYHHQTHQEQPHKIQINVSQARACCGALTGVYVRSSYDVMTNDAISIGDKAAKYGKDASVECDNGSELVACTLHT
jgi:hypothetical protein